MIPNQPQWNAMEWQRTIEMCTEYAVIRIDECVYWMIGLGSGNLIMTVGNSEDRSVRRRGRKKKHRKQKNETKIDRITFCHKFNATLFGFENFSNYDFHRMDYLSMKRDRTLLSISGLFLFLSFQPEPDICQHFVLDNFSQENIAIYRP